MSISSRMSLVSSPEETDDDSLGDAVSVVHGNTPRAERQGKKEKSMYVCVHMLVCVRVCACMGMYVCVCVHAMCTQMFVVWYAFICKV